MKASDFADAVGRKKLSAAAGVGASAVSNAVSRGVFPSSWFLAAADLARVAGVQCDPVLFGMVINNTQDVHFGDKSQPAQKDNKRSGL